MIGGVVTPLVVGVVLLPLSIEIVVICNSVWYIHVGELFSLLWNYVAASFSLQEIQMLELDSDYQ